MLQSSIWRNMVTSPFWALETRSKQTKRRHWSQFKIQFNVDNYDQLKRWYNNQVPRVENGLRSCDVSHRGGDDGHRNCLGGWWQCGSVAFIVITIELYSDNIYTDDDSGWQCWWSAIRWALIVTGNQNVVLASVSSKLRKATLKRSNENQWWQSGSGK